MWGVEFCSHLLMRCIYSRSRPVVFFPNFFGTQYTLRTSPWTYLKCMYALLRLFEVCVGHENFPSTCFAPPSSAARTTQRIGPKINTRALIVVLIVVAKFETERMCWWGGVGGSIFVEMVRQAK